MKILFTSDVPAPYSVDFFDELGKKCDLTVLFTDKYRASHDRKLQQYSFKHFNGIFLKGKHFGADRYSFCPEIIDYIKPGIYDRIIICNPSSATGVLAVKHMQLKKIPYWIMGSRAFAEDPGSIKKQLSASVYSRAQICLSTCKNQDSYYLSYGADKNSIRRYPFSSLRNSDILKSVSSYSEKTELRDFLRIEEQRIVVSVGSFIPRNGADLLIRAAARFPQEVGFYLIGDEVPEVLIGMKNKLGASNVHFINNCSRAELLRYYKAADLFCFPSREDNWGIAINEAMAYGLPIITTDRCNAGVELIENGVNGFVVSAEDVKSLVQKTAAILSDESMGINMGEASLNIIKEYTVENMAQTFMGFFKEEK